MKRDREYEERMDGMRSALKIAEEQGVDALRADIIKRGYYGIDPRIPTKDMDTMLMSISTTVYQNILTCSAYALNEEFGFGEERLKRYKEKFNKVTDDSFEWNYMSKTWVTLTDYAVYLNEHYHLGINVDLVSANETNFQERREEQEKYKRDYVMQIINTLESNGFEDAGRFLESKLNSN